MMIKIASIASWFLGLGFGLPCIYGIWHLWKFKTIWYFLGFPTYGLGPFEKIGLPTNIPLMLGFLLVCILQCAVGYMLWGADKNAAIFSLAIVPFEIAYYIGFALPFGPPFLVIRIVLVILSWSRF